MDNSLLISLGMVVGLGWAISFFMYYISRRPAFYKPEKIIVERGDNIFVSHLPIANLHRRFGKTVLKSVICKVQLAGHTITLFNRSGNAIDIWVPHEDLAKPIFERALIIFADAEAIEID